MASDALPGNAACHCADQPPAVALPGGHGPDVDQVALAAASAHVGLFAGAIAQGRDPGDPADVPSPQTIPTRPALRELLAQSAVGDDTAAEALPGRLFPLFDDGVSPWTSSAGEYAR